MHNNKIIGRLPGKTVQAPSIIIGACRVFPGSLPYSNGILQVSSTIIKYIFGKKAFYSGVL